MYCQKNFKDGDGMHTMGSFYKGKDQKALIAQGLVGESNPLEVAKMAAKKPKSKIKSKVGKKITDK